jgi:hypothetical protein
MHNKIAFIKGYLSKQAKDKDKTTQMAAARLINNPKAMEGFMSKYDLSHLMSPGAVQKKT